MEKAIKQIDSHASDEEYFGTLYASLVGVNLVLYKNLHPDTIMDIERHVLLYQMSIKSLFTLALHADKDTHEAMINQVNGIQNETKNMIKHSKEIMASILQHKNKLN